MAKEYPPHAEKQRLQHGIDVVIPSETAEFDSMSEPSPEMEQAREKLTVQLARVRILGKAMLRSNNGPITMLEELYFQFKVIQARLAMHDKVFEKLKMNLSPVDSITGTAEELEKMMDLEQVANKIIITPDGIFKD